MQSDHLERGTQELQEALIGMLVSHLQRGRSQIEKSVLPAELHAHSELHGYSGTEAESVIQRLAENGWVRTETFSKSVRINGKQVRLSQTRHRITDSAYVYLSFLRRRSGVF
ncbi:MAG: hypothetical protein QW767_05220 [Thermoprotei archaeon]